MYAQKYGPPATGTAERISAILAATNMAWAGQLCLGGSRMAQMRTEESNHNPADCDHAGSPCVQTVEEKTVGWSALCGCLEARSMSRHTW